MVPTLTALSSATDAEWGPWSGGRRFGAPRTDRGAPHPPANVRDVTFLIFAKTCFLFFF